METTNLSMSQVLRWAAISLMLAMFSSSYAQTTQRGLYGITLDEPLHDELGRRIVDCDAIKADKNSGSSQWCLGAIRGSLNLLAGKGDWKLSASDFSHIHPEYWMVLGRIPYDGTLEGSGSAQLCWVATVDSCNLPTVGYVDVKVLVLRGRVVAISLAGGVKGDNVPLLGDMRTAWGAELKQSEVGRQLTNGYTTSELVGVTVGPSGPAGQVGTTYHYNNEYKPGIKENVIHLEWPEPSGIHSELMCTPSGGVCYGMIFSDSVYSEYARDLRVGLLSTSIKVGMKTGDVLNTLGQPKSWKPIGSALSWSGRRIELQYANNLIVTSQCPLKEGPTKNDYDSYRQKNSWVKTWEQYVSIFLSDNCYNYPVTGVSR